jgi:hypothetical protein
MEACPHGGLGCQLIYYTGCAFIGGWIVLIVGLCLIRLLAWRIGRRPEQWD